MNLCIDIGNTNIKLAYYKSGRCCYKSTIKNDKIPKIRHIFVKSGVKSIKSALICSTFPEISQIIRKNTYSFYKKRPLFARQLIRKKINSNYININRLGEDRLVNIYGAIQQYRLPCVVVSFGTAITIDVISRNKVHVGGFILPGLRIALKSLNADTATLPVVSLKNVRGFIGKDTKSCINNGVLYGTAFQIKGFVEKVRKSIKGKPFVLGVGGDAKLIQRHLKCFDKIAPNHTLQSLNQILRGH